MTISPSRRSLLGLAWSAPVIAVATAVPAAAASNASRIELVTAPAGLRPGAGSEATGTVVLRVIPMPLPGEAVALTLELPAGLLHASTWTRTATGVLDGEGMVRFTISASPLARAGSAALIARTGSMVLGFPVPVLPRSTPLAVMALGDSITYGEGAGAASGFAGYRYRLQQRFRDAGLSYDMVGSLRRGDAATMDIDHEGHWGWTSAQVLGGTAAWFERARPEAVLVHIGTNDAFWNHDPDGVGGRVVSMLDQLHGVAVNAVAFVAQIVPARAADVQSRVSRANRSLATAVTAYDGRATVVDCSALLTATHYADGLHPNDSGYVLLADAFADALLSAGGASA